MSRKELHLNVNIIASGRHDGAWHEESDAALLSTNIEKILAAAVLAERGLLDAVFFADYHGRLDPESVYRPWRSLDPVVVLSQIAARTTHIGLVGTGSALFGAPVVLARAYQSLAQVSGGRAAWNIVTSQEPEVRQLYGVEQVLSDEERYAKAGEFVGLVRDLWQSLPQSAVVADKASGRYLSGDALGHVDLQGTYFRAAGVLGVPGHRSGSPVLFQSGNSRLSAEFGACWASAIFTVQRTLAGALTFADWVRQAAVSYGRAASDILVLPGLYPVVGSTDEEAARKKRQLDEHLDIQPLLRRLAEKFGVDPEVFGDVDAEFPWLKLQDQKPRDELSPGFRHQIIEKARASKLSTRELVFDHLSGHRTIVGNPVKVADDMEHWFRLGAADGFNLNVDVLPLGLEPIVQGLVPELQRRQIFRNEYRHDHLRGHLGLTG